MKERPIIFSGEMVRAILDGRKTQTRRVVKPQPHAGVRRSVFAKSGWEDGHGREIKCPYGQLGDRLWVREAFSGPYCMEKQGGMPPVPPSQWPKDSALWYWADGDPIHGDWTRPRPSIHMPLWASRILLEVVSVRVERLTQISNEDAMAEGVGTPRDQRYAALGGFKPLWESINGDDSWDDNPWVWVVEFKRVE